MGAPFFEVAPAAARAAGCTLSAWPRWRRARHGFSSRDPPPLSRRLNRWTHCATCHQQYCSALFVEMVRRRWRLYREAPVSIDKVEALALAGMLLMNHEEFDVAQRVYDESRRGVHVDDAAYRRVILASDNSRARSLNFTGRPHDALDVLTRMGPMMEPCDHVRTRADYQNNVCVTLANLGRTSEALRIADQAVELARLAYGPHDPVTLEATCTQAQLLAQIGRVEEAKTRVRYAVATTTRLFGPDHEHTRRVQVMLHNVDARCA